MEPNALSAALEQSSIMEYASLNLCTVRVTLEMLLGRIVVAAIQLTASWVLHATLHGVFYASDLMLLDFAIYAIS